MFNVQYETMKLPAFIALLLLVISVDSGNLKETIKYKLYKVLNFIDEKYEEIHFDGLFGVTFAHTFLLKSLKLTIHERDKLDLYNLINKCIEIHNKMYPLLPSNPKYMITFRNSLLDANKWDQVLPNQFTSKKIQHLGYYKNWTAETIINNKKANYKGVKSDFCLREILEKSQPNRSCYVSPICEEMMLDENRIDSGYLLTHRLLYLQIIKLHGCILSKKYWDIAEYVTKYCSYIYKEATTSAALDFPFYDIFLEQVVLCGMEGFEEFLNQHWLKNISQWQNAYGCYQSLRQNITKRTSFIIDFGCSDHTTGLGAAALSLHLRYLYYSHFNE